MWRFLLNYYYYYYDSNNLKIQESLVCFRRFLRKKKVFINEELESVNNIDLSSFRTGSMLSAPKTSLDNIRSEIFRMRHEREINNTTNNTKINEKNKLLLVTNNSLNNNNNNNNNNSDINNSDINKFIDTRLRPSEAYCKGVDVINCVKAKDTTLWRQFFLDADEVLRKSNKNDTLHYLQLVYSRIGSNNREKVMETVKKIFYLIELETNEIIKKFCNNNNNNNNKFDDSINEYLNISSQEAREMAWVNVLTNMSDDELQKLWKWGILDFETIEYLAVTTDNYNEADNVDKKQGKYCEKDNNFFTNNQNDDYKKNNEKDDEDNFLSLLPIDQNIETLLNAGEVNEFTASVYENMLLGTSNIDIASAVQKVLQKQYDEISERELHLLERYEEKKHTIKFLTQPTSEELAKELNNSNESKKTDNKRTFKEENILLNESKNSNKSFAVTNKKSNLLSNICVTEAVIDRALCPTNKFLHGVARYDTEFRRSFEVMERIKRRALLDPVFQAAVEEAHKWEGIYTSQSNLQDTNNNNNNNDTFGSAEDRKRCENQGQRQRSKRQKHFGSGTKNASSSFLLGGLFAKPQHAADIPYFYGNIRSYVPPHGRYNMPAPRLSREEMAKIRKKTRGTSRMRYSR